ncbi:hypothetical protein [Streptomyces sp. NBC_01451]|uniref:hypothetical protein n=1 Tax=Streptomyces sp. NBC_01451 TaxID=2903872 RepID=UPI002E2ED651|nr:hypothetical protein [Streptomyces sp. NBC_01451]
MGTSLTPEFWRLFAVLLVTSMTVTFLLSAALDALAVRAQRRHARRRQTVARTTRRTTEAPHEPVRTLVGR